MKILKYFPNKFDKLHLEISECENNMHFPSARM